MQSWWHFLWLSLPVVELKKIGKSDWQPSHNPECPHYPACTRTGGLSYAWQYLAQLNPASWLGLSSAPLGSFQLGLVLQSSIHNSAVLSQGLEGMGMDGQWRENRVHWAALSNFLEEETEQNGAAPTAHHCPWNHAPWWHNRMEQQHGHTHIAGTPPTEPRPRPCVRHVCCHGPRGCHICCHGPTGTAWHAHSTVTVCTGHAESCGIPLPCASVQHGCRQSQRPQVFPKRFLCGKRHVLGHTYSGILYSVWHFFIIHEAWIFCLEECYVVWELWLFLFLNWCPMKTSACNFKRVTQT